MVTKKSQPKKEKVPYCVIRPEKISDREFERLSSSPDFIRRRLEEVLGTFPEIDVTNASGSKGALSNFFFREVNDRGMDIKTARSFSKMFSHEADKYAFEIPDYDRRDLNGTPLTDYQANMMRAAELAYEIAEKKGDSCDKDDKYRDTAIRLLEKNYSK